MNKFLKTFFALCIALALTNSANAMDSVELDLSNQGITDLSQVFIAEGVTRVLLDDNNFTDLSPLQLPSTLKFLSLTGNNLENIDGLVLPEGLEILLLNANQINDLRGAQFPSTLLDLTLSANQIDSFDKLGNLPDSLINLSLILNPISQGAFNAPAGLRFLKISQIPVKKLTDISINNANNLEFIEFLNGQITDISDIGNFNVPDSLRLLDLGGHNVSDIRPIANATNLRGIILDGDFTSLAGVQLPPNLEFLIIDGNFSNLDGLVFNNKLRIFSARSDNLSNVDPATVFPSGLRRLGLRGSLVDLSGLNLPSGLRVLGLLGNSNIVNISSLPKLPKSLRRLNLNRTGLSSLDGLTIPKNVRALGLDDLSITDIPRNLIPRGSKLRKLSADDTNIPNEARKQIRRRIRRRSNRAQVNFDGKFFNLFVNDFDFKFDFPILN